MSAALATSAVEVIHEEFILHPVAVRRINGWFVEGRAIGYVKLGKTEYEFNRVISFRLKQLEDEE